MELYIKAGRLREQQSEGDRESQQQKTDYYNKMKQLKF